MDEPEAIFLVVMSTSLPTARSFPQSRVWRWLIVLLIAAIAIGIRVYAIDRLPPGLFGDEAVEGLDALDILAGHWAIWFHAHLGREPLYVYMVALSYGAFGVSPLSTRLPAVVAGLATIPATFFFVREWALSVWPRDRSVRVAGLTSLLVVISFWHLQMSRDAHRVILLPLVEAVGFGLMWRAARSGSKAAYAGAGAVLGLAVYTYSPGRFVGILVALFLALELVHVWRSRRTAQSFPSIHWDWPSLIVAGFLALVVMLPLGFYFIQNPVQFSRRFESVSVFDANSPAQAFASSVVGNLAQFVVPGAGYQSKHYNLPGQPIFDWLIAPWFLAGLLLACLGWRRSSFRFLLLWFVVMLIPVFLTADMIPKAVRAFGVIPGVFVFPALAMDALIERTRGTWRRLAISLVVISFIGSLGLTVYNYFVAWASLPDLPLAFDSDMVQVSDYIARQDKTRPIFLSTEVYRHPTLMLLGKRAPTSAYLERSTVVRELDARNGLVYGAKGDNAIYLFVRNYAPDERWLSSLAPKAKEIAQDKYFGAFDLGLITPPQRVVDITVSPLLKLVGYSRSQEPQGLVLYWRVTQLPADRSDIQATLTLLDERGGQIAQSKHVLSAPPMEWALGDTFVDWYPLGLPPNANRARVELVRGETAMQPAILAIK